MSSFIKRRISLTVRLGRGTFGLSGYNEVKLTGLRCSAKITKTGGVSLSQLDLRAWGVPLEVMNKLTILNQKLDQNRHNTIIVEAGDDDAGLAVIFAGTLIEAWADFAEAPEVSFVVKATTGYLDALRPVPPSSFRGPVDAAFVLSGIGAQMIPPRTVENSGVQVMIPSPYLPGTLLAQARSVQQQGNFYMIIDDEVIAIWPKDGVRRGVVPVVSADTGMVGYPTFTSTGISLTTLFNPTIAFGGAFKLETIVGPASGFWTPFYVGHDLEAEMPAGKWFTHIEASIFGQALPIPNG